MEAAGRVATAAAFAGLRQILGEGGIPILLQVIDYTMDKS